MTQIKTEADMAPNQKPLEEPIKDKSAPRDEEPASLKSPLGPPATNVPEPPTTKHTSDDDPTGQTSDSNTVKANLEGKDPGPGTIVNKDDAGRRPGEKYEGTDYEHRRKQNDGVENLADRK